MEKTAAPVFKGSELIRAASGLDRDILSALLDPEGRYTEAEVKKKIETFLKKEVK